MSKYNLDTVRHSAAHVMAQAVMRLFPNEVIKFGIGPTIKDGFYYDFELNKRITEEDLTRIEDEMKKIIKENLPITRKVLSKGESIKIFSEKNQKFKVELIEGLPANEEIGCYEQGEFIDLCRGPHVEKTGEIPHSFKLLNTAGAYWKGDSNREMLQRIYAAMFFDKKELKDHLAFLEEAKKRDHRKLGKELELFIFDPVAPASPFFLPKGAIIYNALLEYMRKLYRQAGYNEVITPQIMDVELWKTSGHYEHYRENMYFTNIDEREFAVKPMNCPAHMVMFKANKYSYRDLPLRFADFGRIHRYEKSGVTAGLTRVRTFTQDDAHIFVAMDQIQEEITTMLKLCLGIYKHFGFKDMVINLSTRPESRAGDDATWDRAEAALIEALKFNNIDFKIKEGDGAFYGPKIDMDVADAIGRYHQLGTIQLDFQLNERFDLKFTNKNGELERPVILHRTFLGSLERFYGLYLEHTGGAYPFWIAPVQAVIVPVNNAEHLEYSEKVYKELKNLGFRVEIDDRNESMGFKTRQIQKSKVPFMLVVGEREIQDKALSVRKYGENKSETIKQDALIEIFKGLDDEKNPKL